MLNDLVDKIFVNKKDDVLIMLNKYDLDAFLSTFLIKVNGISSSDFQHKKNVVSSLSSTFLTRVNSVLESIEDKEEKERLEYIFSEISSELMFNIIQKSDKPPEDILFEIKDSLITTCEANNWDKDILFKMLKIDMLHIVAAKANTSLELETSNIQGKIYHYEWLMELKDLEEFAFDLKDKKIIKSVPEFRRLFTAHDGNISVRVNKLELDFVIILFDQLKQNNIIKMKGTKGHFVPLKEYCVDFEKNVLIKNQPKRIKEAILKNKPKHQLLLAKVKAQLRVFKM